MLTFGGGDGGRLDLGSIADFCLAAASVCGDRLLATGDKGVRRRISFGERGDRGDFLRTRGSGGERGRRLISGERRRRASGDRGDRLLACTGDCGDRLRCCCSIGGGERLLNGEDGGLLRLRDRLRLLLFRLYRNTSCSLSDVLSAASRYIFL